MSKLFVLFFVFSASLSVSCGSDDCEGADCDSFSCETESVVDVGWDEKTVKGSPAQIFSEVEGSCSSQFILDESSWDGGGLSITPSTSEGNISATVAIDRSSAKIVKQTLTSGDYDEMCDDYLTVEAKVTVEIFSSPVVTNQKVTLSQGFENDPIGVYLPLDEQQMSQWLDGTDSLSISVNEGHSFEGMGLAMMPLGASCVGNLSATVGRSWEDGMASIGEVTVGHWSSTGCDMREQALDLDEIVDMEALQAELDWAFNNRKFFGAWQEHEDQKDGPTTNLLLDVKLAGTAVCSESDTYIEVPLRITANTEDGIVQNLENAGTVSISLNGSQIEIIGSIRSEIDSVCGSNEDVLSYTKADCSEVGSIRAYLDIGKAGENEGSLEFEIFNKGTNSNGSWDKRVTFKIK